MVLATSSFDCGRGFANRLAARIEFGEDVMGIFDALNTSVAGLQAQSFALQNISGNIANAQTTGYKGIGTSFVDLVPDSTPASTLCCPRSSCGSKSNWPKPGSSKAFSSEVGTGSREENASNKDLLSPAASRHSICSQVPAGKPGSAQFRGCGRYCLSQHAAI